jgi:hypothetical protein
VAAAAALDGGRNASGRSKWRRYSLRTEMSRSWSGLYGRRVADMAALCLLVWCALAFRSTGQASAA